MVGRQEVAARMMKRKAKRMMRRQVAQGMMGRQRRGDRRLGLRDGATGEGGDKRGRDDKGLDHMGSPPIDEGLYNVQTRFPSANSIEVAMSSACALRNIFALVS